MTLLAALSLALWIGLLGWRRGFWKADQLLPAAQAPDHWPEIVAVIPARNEAGTIADVVKAHRAADYPGSLRIIVADDHSEDGTGALAAEAGADVAEVPELPAGWSGKLWALRAGLEKADAIAPSARYVLFTDADIKVDPGLLKKLTAHADRHDLGLASMMARLDATGFWGGLLVPAFIFFFQKLYPFPAVNDPDCPRGAAAGGVMLVRKEALEAIGGLASLKGVLIDDCTLGSRIKGAGWPVGLYLCCPYGMAQSLRDNSSYEAMESMVARSAYTQLGYNPFALLGTLLGLALAYLVPPLGVVWGLLGGEAWLFLVSSLAWLLMAFAYRPTARRYERRRIEALALPLAAFFYGWFTWISAVRHWRGRGARWKGRTYPSAL
jgi:hopene-associated glycosyltransferase HpnB